MSRSFGLVVAGASRIKWLSLPCRILPAAVADKSHDYFPSGARSHRRQFLSQDRSQKFAGMDASARRRSAFLAPSSVVYVPTFVPLKWPMKLAPRVVIFSAWPLMVAVGFFVPDQVARLRVAVACKAVLLTEG